MTQGQFFKRSLTGFNSEFSLRVFNSEFSLRLIINAHKNINLTDSGGVRRRVWGLMEKDGTYIVAGVMLGGEKWYLGCFRIVPSNCYHYYLLVPNFFNPPAKSRYIFNFSFFLSFHSIVRSKSVLLDLPSTQIMHHVKWIFPTLSNNVSKHSSLFQQYYGLNGLNFSSDRLFHQSLL